MITQNLKVNQLSDDAYRRYVAYLEAMDNRDVNAYGNFLADDVSIRFNNEPPMTGKETALEGLAQYWKSFASIEHDIINIYGTDKNYVLEALNNYVRLDGKHVTVRAVAFTDLNDYNLVTNVRIYHDVSPVFQQ